MPPQQLEKFDSVSSACPWCCIILQRPPFPNEPPSPSQGCSESWSERCGLYCTLKIFASRSPVVSRRPAPYCKTLEVSIGVGKLVGEDAAEVRRALLEERAGHTEVWSSARDGQPDRFARLALVKSLIEATTVFCATSHLL